MAGGYCAFQNAVAKSKATAEIAENAETHDVITLFSRRSRRVLRLLFSYAFLAERRWSAKA
jgi:hypothetical protein